MSKWVVLFLGIFFISGCLVRTYTIYKPRKDTEVSGNQGYLMGEPEQGKEKEPRLGKERPITIFEIEFGARRLEPKTEPAADIKPVAKRGTEIEPAGAVGLDIDEEIIKEEIELKEEAFEEAEEDYEYYIVKKNDTLQKISHKFYGTTRKWKLIYEENKNAIKNPDKVYPGTKIKVPVLE